MARKDRIYSRGMRVKAVISAVLIGFLVLLTVVLIIFFSFKKYITYTSEGVRLDVPWLEETQEEENSPGNS